MSGIHAVKLRCEGREGGWDFQTVEYRRAMLFTVPHGALFEPAIGLRDDARQLW
jgi:hypothetical protein